MVQPIRELPPELPLSSLLKGYSLKNLGPWDCWRIWGKLFQYKFGVRYDVALQQYIGRYRNRNHNEFMFSGGGEMLSANTSFQFNDHALKGNQVKYLSKLIDTHGSGSVAYAILAMLYMWDKNWEENASLSYLSDNFDYWKPKEEVNIQSFTSLFEAYKEDVAADKKIDWGKELGRISIYPEETQSLTLCPLHNDTNPSLSINTKIYKWNCLAYCGGGYIPMLISRVLELPWHLIKNSPTPVIGKRTDKLKPKNNFVATRLLSEQHLILKEYNGVFKRDNLIKWGVKETMGGSLAIPIVNKGGERVGWQLRHNESDDKTFSKYQNIDFSVKEHLFGLYRVIPKNFLMLVEGPLDTICLTQHGFPSVAVMGANLYPSQLELLKAYNPKEICVAFDNDEAGEAGLKQALSMLKGSIKTISYIEFNPWDKDFNFVPITNVYHYIKNRLPISEFYKTPSEE